MSFSTPTGVPSPGLRNPTHLPDNEVPQRVIVLRSYSHCSNPAPHAIPPFTPRCTAADLATSITREKKHEVKESEDQV